MRGCSSFSLVWPHVRQNSSRGSVLIRSRGLGRIVDTSAQRLASMRPTPRVAAPPRIGRRRWFRGASYQWSTPAVDTDRRCAAIRRATSSPRPLGVPHCRGRHHRSRSQQCDATRGDGRGDQLEPFGPRDDRDADRGATDDRAADHRATRHPDPGIRDADVPAPDSGVRRYVEARAGSVRTAAADRVSRNVRNAGVVPDRRPRTPRSSGSSRCATPAQSAGIAASPGLKRHLR